MPPKARSTRAKSNIKTRPSSQNPDTPKKRVKGLNRASRASLSESRTAVSGSEDDNDAYQEVDDGDDVKSLHSDALDDDGDQEYARKRKRASPVKPHRAKGGSPRKRRKNVASDEDEDGDGYVLKEGQHVVGKVVQAPKTGRGQCCLYIPQPCALEPTYHRSPSWSIISKHARLPLAPHEA